MQQQLEMTPGSPRRWLFAILVLVAIAAVAATLQLTVEASGRDRLEGDVTVATWVQENSFPGAGYVVTFMNETGRPMPLAALTLAVMLVLAQRRRFAEMALVAPTFLVHPLNWAIKAATASPRPTEDVVRISDPSSGFGFPSGHTMGIVVFCGLVLYVVCHIIECRWTRASTFALATLAALAIGFSRVYSGAHWPSDVLGAYLWGIFFVVTMVIAWRRVTPALSRQLVPNG